MNFNPLKFDGKPLLRNDDTLNFYITTIILFNDKVRTIVEDITNIDVE